MNKGIDNFEFELVGADDKPFLGYISSKDKTSVSPRALVRGSYNVYKKKSGTVASRPGLKRDGTIDSTVAGITAEYVWRTKIGQTYPIRVQGVTSLGADGKLQVDVNGTIYDLLTGLTKTRWVFDKWYSIAEAKDRLIGVCGDSNIYTWSGGVGTVASATTAGSTTSVKLAGNNVLLTSLALSNSNAASIIINNNGNVGTAAAAVITFLLNPSNTDTLTLTINGTAVVINFVSVIGAAAGNVLIGANIAATITNLLGLLQSPGTTTANHVALSAPNQTLVGYLTSSNAGTITVSGSSFWSQLGFATVTTAEKRIVIGGVTYVYTGGENTGTLTGVSPSPAAIVAGTVAVQAVVTTTGVPASSGFNNDFLKVIINRVHIGSYTSRLIYISSQTDFTNYTVPSPRATGDPELIILDSTANGITVKSDNAVIPSGQNTWNVISYTKITVGAVLTEQTTIEKKIVSDLSSAYAHEFIDNVGDDIIYLSKDQQVRIFGTFRNLTEAKYPSISLQIEDELKEQTFTGGHLKAIADFIYVTAPVNGTDYMLETRETVDGAGNVVAERLWHPPQIRNVSRFCEISGVTFGYSNANPQRYQIWDTNQWHDDSPSNEPIPYNCVMRMAYRSFGRRQGLWTFDKVFVEGYIANGVNLNCNVYFDYQGSSGLQNLIINSVNKPAKFFSGNLAPTLGSSSPGDNPLGDGLIPESSDQELLPKFRDIPKVTPVNCFEFCLEVYSTELDSRWEVLCLGVNPQRADQKPTFLT